MSSARGTGSIRGRGRGSTPLAPRGRGRGASTLRGRVFNNGTTHRGGITARARGGFGQLARGSTGRGGRDLNNTRGNAFTPAASHRPAFGGAKTGGNWKERYDVLTAKRETERKDAIKQGLVADPDKPRALSEAITPVGTCQDMCAEFERVERNYQDDVWAEEKGPDGVVDESRMVKKFRRAAAGNEEQLPSDLRSPHVLKRTCDYLFDEVVGNAPSLAQVHHFVWDRTRAIRNDFSIQQLTKLEELRVAVECYERIARFHILSLHQLASPERPYAKYDWPQEREQLDRTLLSLIQYYEDTRDRISFPNEAEFRAYCVLFQLRSPTPDLEDSVQAWPRSLLRDKRVRKALEVYAAGCTVMRPQGPLNPKASHLIARQDWQRIWVLLASNEVSYLMGCVAEVYFNSIRQNVLNALFRTFRMNSTTATPDFTLDLLCDLFAFDDEEEVITYCEYFGFAFKVREDGQQYLDLSSVPGKTLPQPNADMPNQLKSSLVEHKRLGRTLPAVISGMTVRQAQDAGLVVEDEEDEEGMHDVEEDAGQGVDPTANEQGEEEDEESLFIPEDKPAQPAAAASLSNALNAQRQPSPFSWGQPSGTTTSPFSTPASTAQPASGATQPKLDFLSGGAKTETNGTASKPNFNFLGGAPKPVEKAAPSFDFLGAGGKGPEKAAENQSHQSPFGLPPTTAASGSSSEAAPKFDFTGGRLGKSAQNTASDTKAGDPAATAVKSPAQTTFQPNGLFSKPAQGQSGPSNPFQFTPPGSNASCLGPAATTDPGPSKPTATAATTGFKPATFESLPNPPTSDSDSQQNPFLQPPPKSPAPAQTTFETMPSFPGQTRQVQPHSTAPSSNQPPTFPNSQPSPPTLNTGLRRPSTSTDTRPKKPSPLSHSFTAGDDSSSSVRDASKKAATGKAPAREIPKQHNQPLDYQVNGTAFTQDGHLTKPVPFKRKPPPDFEQPESFDHTVSRIAKELVEDPVNGYLKQYIEYKASQYITHVQEEIAAEKMNMRLSELRVSTLCRKYFKRWISLIWQRRFAKSGKNRRERRRRRLEGGFDDGSSHVGDSVRGSRAGSVMDTSSWKDHQEHVDAMFQRTINSRSLARPVVSEQQARAGSKRASSSHGDNGVIARASTHKRLKSTSHIDERGRVAKPTVTSNPNDDLLKRSSFLGFSLNGPSPPNKNTTKSNYFRLKAMGVHRADELSAPRGTKRSRTESTQPAPTASPRLRNSVSRASSPEATPPKALMPPPVSTMSRAERMREEDDALFARMRAARESLTLGTTYMKQEMEKDEDFQRSLSASQSSNESPSMMKARADARARASRETTPERDVPAYRLRESKFVPREHYGRAIERSKEMRESRSRETSRPGSRPASAFDLHAAESSAPPADLSFCASKDSGKQNSVPNGLPTAKAPSYSSFEKASTSFSSLNQPSPPTLANHTTHMSNANPFLQSTVPDSMEAPRANQFTQFGMPKDSNAQPSFGSGPGFGSQSDLGGLPFGSQPQHNSQASGIGFQSGFGPQPVGNHQPAFGSAFGSLSKHTFGNQNNQPAFAAPPQDHTIHPDLVDQSLATSFGSHAGHNSNPVPPQEDSYMPTQTISLLSDDEEEEEVSPAIQDSQSQVNGVHIEKDDEEELLDEETEEEEQTYQLPYGTMNPFALLANKDEDDETQSQSQVEDDETFDQARFDFQGDRGMDDGFESQDEDDCPDDDDFGFDNVYYGGEEDDEDGVNGDIDDDEEGGPEENEGEDFASEDDEGDGEEEEDEPPQQPQPWVKVEYHDPWTARPVPNPALQHVGSTEDAPIELDSD